MPSQEFNEDGPVLIKPSFSPLNILYSFMIVGHKYVMVQTYHGMEMPCFFILLEKDPFRNDKTSHEMHCRFVKHTWRNDDKKIIVEPLWDDVWMDGWISDAYVWNLVPFDEAMEYRFFHPVMKERLHVMEKT